MNEPLAAAVIRRSHTPPAARVIVAAALALLAAVASRPTWAAGCGGGTQAALDGCAEARRVAADAGPGVRRGMSSPPPRRSR